MGALISAPLSMAATCGGSLLGSCCASMACKACSCACTLTQRVSSFVYLGLVYIFLIAAYTFKYQGGPIVIGGSTNATESSILDKMRHAAMDQTVGQISDRWNSNFWCAPRLLPRRSLRTHAQTVFFCAESLLPEAVATLPDEVSLPPPHRAYSRTGGDGPLYSRRPRWARGVHIAIHRTTTKSS